MGNPKHSKSRGESVITVLYVDDEPDLLELGRLFLEASGICRVETATSAAEGLERLAGGCFDAVVSDYQMPGMDGIQLLAEVRERFGLIPFILFTGKGREEVVIQAINTGADFYLQKGGNPSAQFAELSTKIQYAVSRKLAEETLRKRDLQIRNIFDNIPIGVYQSTPDGKFVFVNPAISTMFGYDSPEDLLATVNRTSIADVLYEHPERRPEFIREVLEAGGSWKAFENQYRKRDGAIIDTLLLFSEHSDPVTGQKNLFGFVQDITERKRWEGTLLESEEKFRSLAESSPDYIMRYDRNCRHTYMNPAALRASGLAAEHIIGKTHAESGFDETLSRFWEERITHVFETGEPYQTQFSWESVDGPVVLDWMLTPEWSEDGGVRSVLGVSRDVTLLKEAETELIERNAELQASHAELAASEEELRANMDELSHAHEALSEKDQRIHWILENSAEVLFRKNYATGRYDYMSPAVTGLTGYTPDELIEMSYQDVLSILHPDDVERILAVLSEHMSLRRVDPFSLEYRIRHRNGSIRWINETGTIVYDTSGQPQYGVGSLRSIEDCKQAEDALRESEEKNRGIFETINDALHIHEIAPDGRPGRFVDVNDVACRTLQYTREELLKHGPLDFVTGYHNRPLDEILEELSSTGHAIFETEHRRKDGSTVPVEINSRVVSLRGKRLMVSVVRDITERKRVAEALRNSEARLHTLVQTIPDLIWLKDTNGVFLACNTMFERFFGAGHADIVGKTDYDFVDRDLADFFREHDRRAMAAGKPTSNEEWITFADDGHRALLETIKTPMHDARGTLVGVLGIGRDITDRKGAEDALLASESFNRGLVENLPDYIAVYGQDGTVLYVNPASVGAMGCSAEELVGTSVLSYVAPEHREVVTARMATGHEGHDCSAYEIDIVSRVGLRRSVIAKSTPIRYHDRAAILLLLIDITERKRGEETLRQANRKLNLLSGITRHDIDNQLTVLRGYLTLLESKQPDPSVKKDFEKVAAAAERISAMILFTKEYESIGVNAPLWQDCRTLVDIAARQAPLGKVMVKNDLPPGTDVFADPLIVKVFYNLMGNAGRYGGRITTTRFSVEESGDDRLIVCEDDGIGIPAEEKERIFERGFGKNTGLGLALSREILAITGITITETGEPGKGARFEMLVPRGMYR